MRITFALAALMAASIVPASAQETPAPGLESESSETIAQVLKADGRFTVLLGAIETAGLGNALSNASPLTVFAPTDSAFATLPEGTLESLTPGDLRSLVLGHVLEGAIGASAAAEAGDASSVMGTPLVFVLEDGLTVNGVHILEADLEASNGVIHVIGVVLMPPEAPAVEDGM